MCTVQGSCALCVCVVLSVCGVVAQGSELSAGAQSCRGPKGEQLQPQRGHR